MKSRLKKCSVLASLVFLCMVFFTLVVGASCATTKPTLEKQQCYGEMVWDDDLGLCVCPKGEVANPGTGYTGGLCLTAAEMRARLEGAELSGKPKSESACPGVTVWNSAAGECTCPKKGEYPTKNGGRCVPAVRLSDTQPCKGGTEWSKDLGRCTCPQSNVTFIDVSGEVNVICLAHEELPVRLSDWDRLCCLNPGLTKATCESGGCAWSKGNGDCICADIAYPTCVPCPNSMERDRCESQAGVWIEKELTCDCPGLGSWDVSTAKCEKVVEQCRLCSIAKAACKSQEQCSWIEKEGVCNCPDLGIKYPPCQEYCPPVSE